MTRFLLDSGIATDYIDRRNGVFERALAETQRGNRVGTAIPIGRPMQVIDIMIAAVARTLGNTTVITKDSDLAAVPGLRVENWATSSPP
ncbi:MAG: hypothetical protein LC104_08250 [Bacteroidales bacterium]|nr:hypothetical protein [Bacteroidales bacterium]